MLETSALHTRKDMVKLLESVGHRFRPVGMGSDWSGTTLVMAEQNDHSLNMIPLDFHLFELCLDGFQSGSYMIENLASAAEMDCSYRPGALFFVSTEANGHIDLRGDVLNLQIMIERAVMDEAKAEMFLGDPDQVELFSFNERYNARIKQIARALHLETLMPSAGGVLKADALTYALCLAILQEASHSERRKPRAQVRLTGDELKRCFDALEQEIGAGRGLKAVSEAAGLSPSRFSHGFAGATGQSPHQYLIERRMTRACERLAQTDDAIAEIALDCGFASQSHMTDVFRQKLSVSPGRYRQEACA